MNSFGEGNVPAATDTGASLEIATPIRSIASTYTAQASCPTSPCWLTILVASGSIAASSRAAITARINSQGLQPGVYNANVALTISPAVGLSPSTLLDIPVALAVVPPGPRLTLSQTGLAFQAISSGSAPAAQAISVSTSGTASLPFTAAASTLSGNWLSVSPASATTPAQTGIQVNPAGLAPGSYYGRVDFSSSATVNGSQSVEVVLTVSSDSAAPSLSTSALVFVAAAGAAPPPQPVQLTNPSSQALSVSTNISYANGGGWLAATGSAGSASSTQPLTETVAVNTAGLKPGVYVGSLDLHLAETNSDRLVEVLLVVKAAGCTAKRLLPVITNLEGGFQKTAGVPVPLIAQVIDDCGVALDSGAVIAYFHRGDSTVPLTPLGGGQWSGTWMPHSSGSAAVGLLATGFAPATYGSSGVLGSLAANPSAPLVAPGGIVSAASLTGGPQAAGGLISVFGSNFANALTSADATPYPTTLGGSRILLSGISIPLQASAGNQINAVMPYDAPVAARQQMIVQQNSAYALPETVVVAAAQPAIFTLDQSGQGPGVIVVVKADGTQFVNSPSRPAHTGDALVIYCTGLGAVNPGLIAGSATPFSPLFNTVKPVTASIGGQAATVFFAGLTPGFVGLYQVNAIVPSGLSSGTVSLVLSEGGATSVPVTLAVQ